MAKTGGAVKRLTEKLKNQNTQRLHGRHTRFAIMNLVDQPLPAGFTVPRGKSEAPAVDPKLVTTCEPSRYVAPEGKRHSRRDTRTFGNGTRRVGLDYYELWATDDVLVRR